MSIIVTKEYLLDFVLCISMIDCKCKGWIKQWEFCWFFGLFCWSDLISWLFMSLLNSSAWHTHYIFLTVNFTLIKLETLLASVRATDWIQSQAFHSSFILILNSLYCGSIEIISFLPWVSMNTVLYLRPAQTPLLKSICCQLSDLIWSLSKVQLPLPLFVPLSFVMKEYASTHVIWKYTRQVKALWHLTCWSLIVY